MFCLGCSELERQLKIDVNSKQTVRLSREFFFKLINHLNFWPPTNCTCNKFENSEDFNRIVVFIKQVINQTLSIIDDCANNSEIDSDLLIRAIALVHKFFTVHFIPYASLRKLTTNDANQINIVDSQDTFLLQYCESQFIVDHEVPKMLLHNILHFYQVNGLSILSKFFSFLVSHEKKIKINGQIILEILTLIHNLRAFLNNQATRELLECVRKPAIDYLCQMSEDDLKLSGAKGVNDIIWLALKPLNESSHEFDDLSWKVAKKYFTSQTLSLRLAAINNINCSINTARDCDDKTELCIQMADWIVENNIIEYTFGPNVHSEVVKLSTYIVQHVALEGKLSTKHLECMWDAAKQRHCSRHVYDCISVIIRHLNPTLAHYLHSLISGLPFNEYTEQTIMLLAHVTDNIWVRYAAEFEEDLEHEDDDIIAIPPRKCKKNCSIIQSAEYTGSESSIGSMVEDSEGDHTPELVNINSIDSDSEEYLRQHSLNENTIETHDLKIDDEDYECSSSKGNVRSPKNMNDFEGEDSVQFLEQIPAVRNIGKKIITISPQKRPRPKSPTGVERLYAEDFTIKGKTLLWDFIQEEGLPPQLISEAEKVLGTLLISACNAIRLQFIKAIINNLSDHKTVTICLVILQKLLNFTQNKLATLNIVHKALNEYNLLGYLLHDIKYWRENLSNIDADDERRQGCIRLNFLSFIFSVASTDLNICLNEQEVDVIWNALAIYPNTTNECLNWFLSEIKMHSSYSLKLKAVEHLLKKIPSLPIEQTSMIGMQLYTTLMRIACKKGLTTGHEQLEHVWKIAVEAHDVTVSEEAISYINLLLTNDNLEYEKTLIERCMACLRSSLENLPKKLPQLLRVLQLLKMNICYISSQYAYMLRLWTIMGKGIPIHRFAVYGKHGHQIHLQVYTHINQQSKAIRHSLIMSSMDRVAELRADISAWMSSLVDRNPETLTPVRLSVHGRDICYESDDKTLSEVRLTDAVSINAQYVTNFSSKYEYPPNPPRERLPQLLLLNKFDLLFECMHVVANFKTVDQNVNLLSRRVITATQDLLNALPTEPNIVKKLLLLKDPIDWNSLLSGENAHRLLYTLNIIDALAKPSKFSIASLRCSADLIVDTDDDSSSTFTHRDSEKSWKERFIDAKGLQHFVKLLFCKELHSLDENGIWNDWQQECIVPLVKLILQLAIHEDDEADYRRRRQPKNKVFRLREILLNSVDTSKIIEKLKKILYDATATKDEWQLGAPTRSHLVHFTFKLLNSWCLCSSNSEPFGEGDLSDWVYKLTVLEPEPNVRRETTLGLHNLCIGQTSHGHAGLSYLKMIIKALLSSLNNVLKLPSVYRVIDSPEKESDIFGPSSRDYFAILEQLLENIRTENVQESFKNEWAGLNLNQIMIEISKLIQDREIIESRHESVQDICLYGLLSVGRVLAKMNPPFKDTEECLNLTKYVYWCLFALPDKKATNLPKCKSDCSRLAAYELLMALMTDNEKNFMLVHDKIKDEQTFVSESINGWDLWPSEESRANCGYVGLTNLGATCYLATCMQHVYMIPKIRKTILETEFGDMQDNTLKEIQKMYAFLLESERKAYSPKGLCSVYLMDRQPLNTTEQKDMSEFFTDLLSKFEEMDDNLKNTVKSLFGGVISNNVVSLDCGHVSRTREDFYTVRCQVEGRKNLYESLDEVTVKDVLDGDNMYTCMCEKKVRAEKRACFRTLPNYLCFNIMRYTFNMLTMTKEKINTHFSFPTKLDMSKYMECNLMNTNAKEVDDDPIDIENFEFELVGVTVHTGNAEGGHYYSFIRDKTREKPDENTPYQPLPAWFMFNDSEVKHWDSAHIASECFGGHMTSKTYDSVHEKYMDLSYEKSNSAYMLFYERIYPDMPISTEEDNSKIELSPEIADWIWEDNMKFLREKNLFDQQYFNFIWYMCNKISHTIPNNVDLNISLARIMCTFVMDILLHAREKAVMMRWIEALSSHLTRNRPTCEWFFATLVDDNMRWPKQILLKCPNNITRELFQRLLIHIAKSSEQRIIRADDRESNVAKFFLNLLDLLHVQNATYCKHMHQYFSLLTDWARLGSLETEFLLNNSTISHLITFYLRRVAQRAAKKSTSDIIGPVLPLISPEIIEIHSSDDDDDEEDERERLTSLDCMISLILMLIDESRSESNGNLSLSTNDSNALYKENFIFINKAIRDGANHSQIVRLCLSLIHENESLTSQLAKMLVGGLTSAKLKSISYSKIISILIEQDGCETILLNELWLKLNDHPAQILEWFSDMVSKIDSIRLFVRNRLDEWVWDNLIMNHEVKVRTQANNLFVRLAPLPQCRFHNLASPISPKTITRILHNFNALRETNITLEERNELHYLLKFLLSLIPRISKQYSPITMGPNLLNLYFNAVSMLLFSKAEQLLCKDYLIIVWNIYYPRLTHNSHTSQVVCSNSLSKQGIFQFLHHACLESPENIEILTNCETFVKNIPFNYILADHEDPETIRYNAVSLPTFYGLLKMCCIHSRKFAKHLSTHENLLWAFKNILPYPAKYSRAINELQEIMRFLSYREPEYDDDDILTVEKFRQDCAKNLLSKIDPSMHWGVLVLVIKTLVQSEKERILAVENQAIPKLFQSIVCLHKMYYEATACNVLPDLIDVLECLEPLLKVSHTQPFKTMKCHRKWPPAVDIVNRLITLLNAYASPDLRTSTINVLKQMLLTYQVEAVKQISSVLLKEFEKPPSNHPPSGQYWPSKSFKGHEKRTARPHFAMRFSNKYLEVARNHDKEYDTKLDQYFEPFYGLIDLLVRVAINANYLTIEVVQLSTLAGCDGAPLHSTTFAKVWRDVFKSSPSASETAMKQLRKCDNIITEYLILVLCKYSKSLSLQPIYEFCKVALYEFIECLLERKPDIMNGVFMPRILDAVSRNQIVLRNLLHIEGDVRAVDLLTFILERKELNKWNIIPLDLINALRRVDKLLEDKSDVSSEEDAGIEKVPRKRRKTSSSSGGDQNVETLKTNVFDDSFEPKQKKELSKSVITDTNISMSEIKLVRNLIESILLKFPQDDHEPTSTEDEEEDDDDEEDDDEDDGDEDDDEDVEETIDVGGQIESVCK